MQTIKNLFLGIGLTIGATVAHAESQLPAGTFSTLSADAIDTVSAVTASVIPVAVTVAIVWSAVSWAKRGTKAATK